MLDMELREDIRERLRNSLKVVERGESGMALQDGMYPRQGWNKCPTMWS